MQDTSYRKTSYRTTRNRTRALELALQGAEAKRSVFPVRGKEPAIPKSEGGSGYKDASRDRTRITALFNTRGGRKATGYGIATGRCSSVVVVDVDGPKGRTNAERMGLRSDYVVESGRSEGDGFHLYFTLPPGVELRSRTLAPGVELKAEGCYVVGPGSLHPSGATYRLVKDGTPSPAPDWILEPDPDVTPRDAAADSGPVTVDVAGPLISEGERNDTLTRIAGLLHNGTRDQEQLVADLLAVNEARCSPPIAEHEVRRIAASIYRRTPCKPSAEVTSWVLAAVDYLREAASNRPVKGMGGATGWSVYMAALKAAQRWGREHPDGVEFSLDVRTWAAMAGTHASTVSRFVSRSPLVSVVSRGSGRRSGSYVLRLPTEIGHKLQHSSTRGGAKENTSLGSVAGSALLRTLERLRWGPGRIGKSRAAILHTLAECDGVLSRSDLAARLGRKPESMRAPLRWLVDNRLLERVGHGVYALPADFAHRVEDARELGDEPKADRLQIARHARERDGYRNRERLRADHAPAPGETAQRREAYPERRTEAIQAAIARLFAERPEYRTRRLGQVTCALIDYLGPEFPRGPDGVPKDAEVETILAGEAA